MPISLLLDTELRRTLIDGMLGKLREHYVFPDLAEQMTIEITSRLTQGDYEGMDDPAVFRDRLIDDLRAVCHDKHLRLVYYPEAQPPRDNLYTDPDAMAEYWAEAALENYGYTKAERLPGNVGYLCINALDEAEMTADTITTAMRFIANTFALILDLRQNTGGAPTGVAFLCSYLFAPEPVHLNDVYSREGDTTQQYWTLPSVPGPRYLEKPVYVLTSQRTFSAGEELAYDLQALKRATIVGEVTRGGANPVDVYQIHPHFAIRVPTCRAINPITGTNWEGVGVQPDIAVVQEEALATAHQAALEQIVARYGPEPGPALTAVWAEIHDALASMR